MIKIAKNDLEAALKVVSSTVGSNGAEISGHYLFRYKAGVLTLLSFNNRTFSSCPVVCASDSQGDLMFTSEAWRVQELLNAVPVGTVLIFEPGASEVVVSGARGKLEFSSLNPSSFPFWDDLLAEAKETARLPANRLKRAFDHAAMFISNDEARAPFLCVAEFRKGLLYSTDQIAVSAIKVPGMENSAIRVHEKNIAALRAFLDSAKETEISVLEHDRSLFIVRADGATFGESRFGSRFPDFDINWDLEDDYKWSFSKEDFTGNVKFLRCAAVKNDTKLTLKIAGEKTLDMAMKAQSGKPNHVSLESVKMTVKDGALDLPETGVDVSHKHLGLTMGACWGENVTLCVSKREKGGWVRLRDEREGNVYLTTVAWIKPA